MKYLFRVSLINLIITCNTVAFSQGINEIRYDFEGIVAAENCSGSLIKLEGVSDSSEAWVLTNGHCHNMKTLAPGNVLVNKKSKKVFFVLNSDSSTAGEVTATRLLYGTMTGTDVAIYRTRETYAQIKAKFGIRPMILSSQRPVVGTPIEIISGYWKKGYSCKIEAFIPSVSQAGWMWQDSIRYSRPGCEIVGGTSGSPILQAGTKTVIGINNTANDNGLKCKMNNPCEIDAGGETTSHKGYGYGQQTYQIYTCLTATNEIDLSIPGCELPK